VVCGGCQKAEQYQCAAVLRRLRRGAPHTPMRFAALWSAPRTHEEAGRNVPRLQDIPGGERGCGERRAYVSRLARRSG
jgi:hypothetical protein